MDDMISLQEAYKKDRRESRKRSIEGILSSLQKQKLFSTIISGFRKANSKLQFEAKRIVMDENYSTKMMTFRKSRSKKMSHSQKSKTIELIGAGKCQLTQVIPNEPQSAGRSYMRKVSIVQKKPSMQLPSLLSMAASNCAEINAKDKRLHQLFLRIARVSNPNEFVYNVNMPKRFLGGYLEKEYSSDFSNYFLWFFDVRPTIDYKYYIDLGEKLLTMTGKLIAHFVYAAFEGFSLDASFRMFRDGFGSADLLFINQLKSKDESPRMIKYTKRSYDYWREGGKSAREDVSETSPCSRTIYKSSFMYNDSKLDPEIRTEKDANTKSRPKKEGEISFEDFCRFYSGRLPHLYIDILFRMYLVEVVDGRLDESFKRSYLDSIEQLTRRQNSTANRSRQTARQQVSRQAETKRTLTDRVQNHRNLKHYAEP